MNVTEVVNFCKELCSIPDDLLTDLVVVTRHWVSSIASAIAQLRAKFTAASPSAVCNLNYSERMLQKFTIIVTLPFS